MRRFINSLVGKLVCHVAVISLLWPSVTCVLLSKADAQVQTLPVWAIVDFTSAKDQNKVGVAAAEAVQSALARAMQNQIDLVPRETVSRTIVGIGLQSPVTDLTSLLRLGQELNASTIVTGDVFDFTVSNVGGGKKADVILRIVVRDVASGLPINGAALSASSSVRTGEADDMTVINEALATAAARAVSEIKSKTLPTATVLNTLETTALINQGTRTGFEKGMELIVLRGREQVATARVSDVEPDSAIIRIERSIKGIQPGDRVRAIFDVPDITGVRSDGSVKVKKRMNGRPHSDFGTLAIVGLVLGVLLSQGRSSGFNAAQNVISEATLFPNFSGDPAIRVKWSRDLFARGNSQQVQWQIYRNDILGSPILVIPGVMSEGFDDSLGRSILFEDFGGLIGGASCTFAALQNNTATVPGVTPGRPYSYSLALVYKIASIDLPGSTAGGGAAGGGAAGGGAAGGIGGTTGGVGGSTVGGATGGTVGGTTTGGATGGATGAGFCYFISRQQSARGLATAYARVGLVSPGPNAVVSTDTSFTFTSVVNPTFPTTVEYALQISPDPTFPGNRSKIYARVIRTDSGTLSTGNVDVFDAQGRFIPGLDFRTTTQEWFWRIGARNTADIPGPMPDQSGQRYIFGANRRFTIPTPPPPPPAL